MLISAITGFNQLTIIPQLELTVLQFIGFLWISIEFILLIIYKLDFKKHLQKRWIRRPLYFHIISCAILLPLNCFLWYKIFKLFIVSIYNQFLCQKNLKHW